MGRQRQNLGRRGVERGKGKLKKQMEGRLGQACARHYYHKVFEEAKKREGGITLKGMVRVEVTLFAPTSP